MEAAALFLAQEGGYFEAEGAKATLQRVAAPEEALRALQQGQVSAALVTLEQLLGSVGSARPVVAIGLVNGSIPFNVVLRTDVAQARGLDTTASLWERYQALKGLRIGVPPGKVAQAIAEEVLYVARLDPISDVRLVPVAEGDTITALTSGRVDALLARHPYAERAIVEQNAFLLLHLSRGDLPSLEPFPWLLLVTTSERLNSERDALFGLVRGLFQAQQAMRRNAIFASRALAPAFPDLPEPVYQKGVQLYFPAVPGTPLVTPEAFSRALRSLGREPLPFASVVDNRLVADALGR
jgi:ABC-type nitrate/sulfonate/bicarbonate transport system substrate-binding protein